LDVADEATTPARSTSTVAPATADPSLLFVIVPAIDPVLVTMKDS
jgi:hypothetical protein